MTLTDFYKDDLTFTADIRTLTVIAKRYASDKIDTVSNARQLELSELRQVFGGVQLRTDSRGYMIPNDELTNITEIQEGDVLKDGTTKWTVERVQQVHFNHQWICQCHKFVGD